MGGVLAWVARVACLRRWRRWRANLGCMLLLLLCYYCMLLLLKHYPEEKMLSVNFTKMKKCSK